MNPYQPPEASLDDPVEPKIARPPEVTRACRIFWWVLMLTLVSQLPSIRGEWWKYPGLDENAEIAFLIFAWTFGITMNGAYALLIWLVSRRHNWARWTFLALLLFGWRITTNALSQTFSTTPFAAVIDMTCIAAEVWAACLLFFGPGGRWFKATPPAAQSNPRM